MPTEPQSSRIYYLIKEKLKDSNDAIGMFAYAIYKREKMAERNRLKDSLGRNPTNEEMNNFVLGAETRIDSYLKMAEVELSEFQNALLGEYIDGLSADYAKKYLEETQKFQPQPPPSWIKQVLYGVGGNFATALITVAIFLMCVVILDDWPSLTETLIKILQKFAHS